MASTYQDRELDKKNEGQGTSLGQMLGATVSTGKANTGSTLLSGTGGTQGSYQERLKGLMQSDTLKYQPGDNVTAARDYLDRVIEQKPGSYNGKYTSQVEKLYDQIMNRQKFSYNMNNDAMYQMYAQRYKQQGLQSMRDTMGQAMANTGGYGSSYAQTAGQGAYNASINALRDQIPQLQNQAVQRYNDETNRMSNMYGMANQADQTEYGRYQDRMNMWQNERDYAANRADSEYARDYGAYQQQMQAGQTMLGYEREDAQQDTQSAQTLALQMIQAGIQPSTQLIERTGWDPENVTQLLEKYK